MTSAPALLPRVRLGKEPGPHPRQLGHRPGTCGQRIHAETIARYGPDNVTPAISRAVATEDYYNFNKLAGPQSAPTISIATRGYCAVLGGGRLRAQPGRRCAAVRMKTSNAATA